MKTKCLEAEKVAVSFNGYFINIGNSLVKKMKCNKNNLHDNLNPQNENSLFLKQSITFFLSVLLLAKLNLI